MKKHTRDQKSQRSVKAQSKTTTEVPSKVAAEFMTAYLCNILKDGNRILAGHYSLADLRLDLDEIQKRVKAEGQHFATKTLPALVKGLLELYEGHDASFPQFKLQRGMDYPQFLKGMFRLALTSTNPELKRQAFDVIYSLSVAFKKLKGPYSKTVLLKQFKDFVEVDEELRNLDFFGDEAVYSILEYARAIIATIVRDVDINDHDRFLPRPGPGATNTHTEKTERYRPRVLYTQINDVLDYQEWWYPNPWDACQESRNFLSLHKRKVAEPVARFKFVPKTRDKARGICIEENEMQVMQQAIREGLYRLFDDALYPNVAITEQRINAQLALNASSDRVNATIDMSEASDRVSRELVSWLFQDNQDLHNVLMALSTRWIKPPNELTEEFPDLIRTAKYAPMGSALCFPVMTLVHYALIISIMKHNTYIDIDRQDLSKLVYVYGDDIVLPSVCTEDVFHWLPKFGMKLNKTKSFYRSLFRESCGVHAYGGVDVTPVYIKYIPYHNLDVAVAATYAVESQLNKKGLSLTAEFLRATAAKNFGYTDIVPANSSQAGFTRSFLSLNEERRFKTKRRRKWNSNLQCDMYMVDLIGKQVENKIIEDDLSAYLRWLWQHTKNEGPPGSSFGKSKIGDSHGGLIIRRRLVPESALIMNEVDDILHETLARRPVGRTCLRRESVIYHKVVLRQSGVLQQQGAAYGCVFC